MLPQGRSLALRTGPLVLYSVRWGWHDAAVLVKSYRAVRKLSEGGMGVVSLALTSNPLRPHVVLKRLLTPEDTAARELLVDEARISCALRHRNIVEVYDIFEKEGELYLEMEWVRGKSLSELLLALRHRPVDPRLAAAIIHDVCRALDAAWRTEGRDGQPLAVIHRDITPNNVMLTFEGGVKVIDFGLARTSGPLTPRSGGERGTPEYLSPERAQEILWSVELPVPGSPEPEPLDGRSDLFCAGLLLHELVTGRSLFHRAPPEHALTPEERWKWQREALARIVRCWEPLAGLPGEVEGIVRKALARRREDRYATGREMADALREVMGGVDAAQLGGFLRQCFPEGPARLATLEADLDAAATASEVSPPPLVAPPPPPVEPPALAVLTPAPEPVPSPSAAPPPPAVPEPSRGRRWWGVLPVLALLAVGVWALWPAPRPSAQASTVDKVVGTPNFVGSEIEVIVGAEDARGRPMPELPIWLLARGPSGTTERREGRANATGTARFKLSWAIPEEVTLSVLLDPGPRQVELSAGTVRFEAGLPDAHNSRFVEVPQKAPVGQEVRFLVALADKGNHPTAGWEVTFNVVGQEDPFESLVKADERGVARLRYQTRWVGQRTVRASVVTEEGRRELEPVVVEFEAGPPHAQESSIAVHGPSGSGAQEVPPVADGQQPVEVEVVARDEYGNPCVGRAVRLEASEVEGALLEQPAPTDEQGHARGVLRATRAGPLHVRALLDAASPRTVELGADVTFVPGPPNEKGSAVLARPERVVLSGKNSSVLTASVHDAHDNPIAGVRVRFAVKGVGSRVEPAEASTDEKGQAHVTLWATRIGSKQVTATVVRSETGAAPLQLRTEVRFEASAPGTDKSTLSASPLSALADGQEGITVTVVVRDANGHPVQGRYVQLSSSDAEGRFDQRMGPTDALGSVSTRLTSSRAMEVLFSANIEPSRSGEQELSIHDQVMVRFVSSPPDDEHSHLTISASSQKAGDTATLQLEVLDARGHPLPGAKVQWKVSDAKALTSQRALVTDVRGVASAAFVLTSAGHTRITALAEAEGHVVSKDVEVSVEAGPADSMVLRADPAELLADGQASTTLTLLVRDSYGNPVDKQEVVAWEGVEPSDTFAPAAYTTNAAGVVTATLSSKKAGQRSVRAVLLVGDKKRSADCTVNFKAPEVPVAKVAPVESTPGTEDAAGANSSTTPKAVNPPVPTKSEGVEASPSHDVSPSHETSPTQKGTSEEPGTVTPDSAPHDEAAPDEPAATPASDEGAK